MFACTLLKLDAAPSPKVGNWLNGEIGDALMAEEEEEEEEAGRAFKSSPSCSFKHHAPLGSLSSADSATPAPARAPCPTQTAEMNSKHRVLLNT